MIYLTNERDETRATTNYVMAAVEAFWGWMLYGPRQHEGDCLWSLGPVPRASRGETLRESWAGK